MADPVDEIIETLTPQPPADPPAENTATVDKAELERLQSIAKQFEQAAPTIQMLQENPGLIHDLRARAVEQQAPPPPPEATDYDWADPAKSTKRIAEQVIQQYATPAVAATNAKLASLAIANFKATLTQNPYYHVCVPLFDKKLSTIPKDQLGALPDDAIIRTLTEAWNASVGEYSNGVTQKRMAERAAAQPPPNLGAGSGGGAPAGPKVKRHLREIDPLAYNMAVSNGFTEEQMAELAEEIDG